MEWTNLHDVLLCREILVVEPYKAKPRTSQRGQLWNTIAEHLNKLAEPKFIVGQRSVRDRFKLLRDKFKRKIAVEERGSGISPEMSELDTLLEEILELEESYTDEHFNETVEKKRKEQIDKENANDMRLKAMETLRETQKRKADTEGDDKKLKQRSKGSEAVHFLKERMENERQLWERELEIKKKDLENEALKSKKMKRSDIMILCK